MGATSFQRMRRQQELKERLGGDEDLYGLLFDNNIEQVPQLQSVEDFEEELNFPNDMSKKEVKAICKRLAKAKEDGLEEVEETEEETETKPKDMTVEELEDHMKTVDIVADALAIMKAEEANKDRKTAKEAIQARIDEIEAEKSKEDEDESKSEETEEE